MISKKDYKIITNLRKDGRIALTKMSKETSIPVSTIFDRIKFHQNQLIQKHTCLLRFEKLGFTTRATVCLRVPRKTREELKQHLLSHQNINSVFKINNGYDFLIETVFKTMGELEDFFEQVEEKFLVTEKQVYYMIDELKRESFLSDPTLANIVT